MSAYLICYAFIPIQVENNASTIIIDFICPLKDGKKYVVLVQNKNFGSENIKGCGNPEDQILKWSKSDESDDRHYTG